MLKNLFKNPPFHVIKRTKTSLEEWKAWLIRIGAMFAGLLVAYLIVLSVSGTNPGVFFYQMFRGCFGSTRRTWITIRETMILLGVGLALVPAFKMKFWNLGGNGQILIGDLAAISCMVFMGNAGCPDWAIILVMIPASILAGAIWAVIPALFKAIFNTNESLFTLMMNYIAAGIVSVFLSAVVTSGSGTLGIVSKGNLPSLFDNENLLPILIIVLVFAFIFVYLQYSKHGYELSVVGESQNTAKYIGINVKKVIIRTMALSGAICGLVGFILAAGLDHSITTNSDTNMGFTAIMVVWLGQMNPIAMVGTSFILSFIDIGMSQVRTTVGLTDDAIGSIATGIIYLAIIASEFFVSYQVVRSNKKIEVKAQKEVHPEEIKDNEAEVNRPTGSENDEDMAKPTSESDVKEGL